MLQTKSVCCELNLRELLVKATSLYGANILLVLDAYDQASHMRHYLYFCTGNASNLSSVAAAPAASVESSQLRQAKILMQVC